MLGESRSFTDKNGPVSMFSVQARWHGNMRGVMEVLIKRSRSLMVEAVGVVMG